MLIEIFCKYVLVLFIIFNNQSFCKKLETYVKDYIPFPERIKELELVPNQFSWSMQNEFIFIDNSKILRRFRLAKTSTARPRPAE